MGKTVAEVCDKVVRANDEIIALRDEVEQLRACAGIMLTVPTPLTAEQIEELKASLQSPRNARRMMVMPASVYETSTLGEMDYYTASPADPDAPAVVVRCPQCERTLTLTGTTGEVVCGCGTRHTGVA